MKIVKILSLCLFVFLIGSIVMFAEGQEAYRQLTDVQIKEVPKGLEIIFKTTGSMKYKIYRIRKPDRLVVDMQDTLLGTRLKKVSIKNPLVERVRLAQFKPEPEPVCRAVLDLKDNIDYQVKESSYSVVLSVMKKGTGEAGKDEGLKEEAESGKPAESQPPPAEPKETVKIEKNVPDGQHLREVQKIRERELKEKEEQGKALKEEVSTKAFPSISSEIVSLNFHNADIREVLRMIAEQTGINIVYGADVIGTITINLKDVPFDDAMEIILKLSGLVAQQETDRIIRIMTPERLSKERSQAVTFTRIFTLNYAKPADVKSQLETIKPAGSKAIMGVDDRTNSLIVTDTPEGLRNIAKLLETFDTKPEQVIIESRVMELTYGPDIKDFGVKWAFAQTKVLENGNEVYIGGEEDTSGAKRWGYDSTRDGVVDAPGSGETAILYPDEMGTGVYAPGSGQTAAFTVGFFDPANLVRLEAQLTAMVSEGKGRILSTPHVATMNNKEARILVGEKIPYKETMVTSGGQTETIKYLDVGIRLAVTPTINPDNKITLKVKPEVSSVGALTDAGYRIKTREAETTVIVGDGETFVIGGLITEDELASVTKVPFLGDIPLISQLFKHNRQEKNRSELLVFITPRLIKN